MKVHKKVTITGYCEECDCETTLTDYKLTLYGRVRKAVLSVLYFLRLKKRPDLQVANEILKYHYKPLVISDLYEENVIMKHLKDRQDDNQPEQPA